jgi:hypothetical protein
MSEEFVELREEGYAMIAGERCPVVGVHLCKGTVSLRVIVPAGFKGCKDGAITLFGHDDKGIAQIPESIDLPPVSGEDSFGVLEVPLGTIS